MKRSHLWLMSAGGVCLALGLALQREASWWGAASGAAAGAAPPTPVLTRVQGWLGRQTPPPGPMAGGSGPAAASPQGRASSPLDTMILPTFRATPGGHLVKDPQTRTDVERMVALFSRHDALLTLDAQSIGLPDAARRELRELFHRYAQYNQAVSQLFPAGQDNATLDEVQRQLDQLHELRLQYFGQEDALVLYGEEESTARELLEVMRRQTDPSLPLAERAERAQVEWSRRQ